MKKIWDIKIGDNWSSHTVEARNYIEAGRKALRISEAPRTDKWISKIECVREIEE